MMTPEQLRDLAVAALEDRKGEEIRVLDVQGLTTISDYMIVVSGGSDRQVRALADSVVERAREAGIRPLGVEGAERGEWVLVDLGDVIVHAMQRPTRLFYQLEKLWSGGEESTPRAGEQA